LERIVDGGAHRSATAVQLLAGAADDLTEQKAVGNLQGSGEYQSRAHRSLVEQELGCIGEGVRDDVSGEVATYKILRFAAGAAELRNGKPIKRLPLTRELVPTYIGTNEKRNS
jgi:hypothetical protein